MNEVIDEMFGLSVFPLLRVNGERFLAERIRITLAQLRESNFRERIQADNRRILR